MRVAMVSGLDWFRRMPCLDGQRLGEWEASVLSWPAVNVLRDERTARPDLDAVIFLQAEPLDAESQRYWYFLHESFPQACLVMASHCGEAASRFPEVLLERGFLGPAMLPYGLEESGLLSHLAPMLEAISRRHSDSTFACPGCGEWFRLCSLSQRKWMRSHSTLGRCSGCGRVIRIEPGSHGPVLTPWAVGAVSATSRAPLPTCSAELDPPLSALL